MRRDAIPQGQVFHPSWTTSPSLSMDVVCDTLIVEEILPRLLPKCLLRLAATSRGYNALTRRPDFAARYWQRTGVFFQPLQKPVDLTFLPEASAEEKAYLRHVGRDPEHGMAIVHSAAGLLLYIRGHTSSLHCYVCNPMTWQWVALPELPLPVCNCNQHCGHLTVATGGEDGGAAAKGFQVVLVNLF
ncbi:uncharacterized protein [Miscanthus floridulus]|uniref:uncharacterized protein n=1 Tax=Miscanthus floridulus TaxID=154761 RepID=UPI003457B8AA